MMAVVNPFAGDQFAERLPGGEAGGLVGYGPGNNPKTGGVKAGIGPANPALGR